MHVSAVNKKSNWYSQNMFSFSLCSQLAFQFIAFQLIQHSEGFVILYVKCIILYIFSFVFGDSVKFTWLFYFYSFLSVVKTNFAQELKKKPISFLLKVQTSGIYLHASILGVKTLFRVLKSFYFFVNKTSIYVASYNKNKCSFHAFSTSFFSERIM